MSDATIRSKILDAIDLFESDGELDKLRSRIVDAFEENEPFSLPDQVYEQNARREYGKQR